MNPSSALSHQYYSTRAHHHGTVRRSHCRGAAGARPGSALGARRRRRLAIRYLYAGTAGRGDDPVFKDGRRQPGVRASRTGVSRRRTSPTAPTPGRSTNCSARSSCRATAPTCERTWRMAWPPPATVSAPSAIQRELDNEVARALPVAVSPGVDRGGVGRSGRDDARARAGVRRSIGVDGVPSGPARVRARASDAGVPAPARTRDADALTRARRADYLSIVIIGALNDASPSTASAHAQ